MMSCASESSPHRWKHAVRADEGDLIVEPITIREILAAVNGTLLGEACDLDTTVRYVDTDSRKLHEGSLFLPLEGERFDGHSFINVALEGGAAGCLTARERESYLPGKFYIKVRSTQRALRDLARYYKQKFPIPYVAITGSVGKTTTKDMVSAVLGERYKVLKTDGNFNNAVGLPLTLLRLNREHQICVLEMGMNHIGEIDYLSDIVEPDVAIITNIGDSHIENLGSRENILKAKCEIFNHLKPNGTVILNGDDELLRTLPGTLPYSILTCGVSEGLDYTAYDVESNGLEHLSCKVKTPRGKCDLDIPALGSHMVYPALMAAAVGELFGLTGEDITRGVQGFLPTKMRMNIIRRGNDIVVLNDAYNANPQSMRAAAAVLGDSRDRRKVAVLGDMLELGVGSDMFHRAVGGYFAEAGTDCLIAVGHLASYIAEGARDGGVPLVYSFESKEKACEALSKELRAGTTILVKASRAMAFEQFVNYIIENTAEETARSD